MKKTPQTEKLEQLLRSSGLSAGGFMGRDRRPISEIIETDRAEVQRLGYNLKQIAARMQALTDAGVPAFGNSVIVDQRLDVRVEESRGRIVCPWPHAVGCPKRVTTIRDMKTEQTIRYADLNVHLIAEHGFFEGRGSTFRLEPAQLIALIFGAHPQ